MLESWKTSQSPAAPAPPVEEPVLDKAARRVREMDDDTLEAFAESSIGGVVRDLGHWRSTGERGFGTDALLSLNLAELSVKELLRRR